MYELREKLKCTDGKASYKRCQVRIITKVQMYKHLALKTFYSFFDPDMEMRRSITQTLKPSVLNPKWYTWYHSWTVASFFITLWELYGCARAISSNDTWWGRYAIHVTLKDSLCVTNIQLIALRLFSGITFFIHWKFPEKMKHHEWMRFAHLFCSLIIFILIRTILFIWRILLILKKNVHKLRRLERYFYLMLAHTLRL